MRLATVMQDGGAIAAVLVGDRCVLPLAGVGSGLDSVRGVAASGQAGLRRVHDWVRQLPPRRYRSLDDVELGPAIPDPGAIYTIGLNYGAPADEVAEPPRPLVYAKLATSVVGHGAVVAWDRTLTANVDPEVELGVVIGETAVAVRPQDALDHVFGYTCINDISSRDPWLDGDQWLLGKSLAGFCPVGPWVVTPDEGVAQGARLSCTINGTAIQDDTTSHMRHSIAALIAYLSRHTVLRPGDLIATGTPARLAGPLGPERHLQPGDVVTCWIEGIGELTTTIG